MTLHETAHTLVRDARTHGGGTLPPDAEQVVRFYAGARALYDRAAEHVVRTLRAEGAR